MPTANIEPWQAIAQRKQEERLHKIPAHCRIPADLLPPAEVKDVQSWPETSGFFTPSELRITDLKAHEVVAAIAAGQLSAVEVLEATCKRASVAQQLLNCVTEIYFDQAKERATALDAYFQKEGKTIGPLHGLPISFKDQFNLTGVDASVGYISWAEKPATKDSTLVSCLIQAGAVPFIKTNIPATLMGESVNNIFGRTCNPRNRDLTTGGSSGGESALVTFRGSFLGVGTDIGGSIRHPCSFTGLYGLRPSHGRVSYNHVANTYIGQEAVRSCAGPMCRSPADIRLFMASLLAQKPWIEDPQSLPIPWRTEEEKLPAKLVFGWSMGDGVVQPTPPLRRAMEITKAKLIAAGHEVVDYLVTEMTESSDIIHKMWTADGGEDFSRDLDVSGEPWQPEVACWGSPETIVHKQSVSDTWANQQQRQVLSGAWLDRLNASASLSKSGRCIDAIIIPSTPFPAKRHGGVYPHHYGSLSPLLDLTTGVFPVTSVDPVLDVVPVDWKPISEKDQQVRDFYGSPDNHKNALVGLALVGRRLEEEKVTAMLSLLESILHN